MASIRYYQQAHSGAFFVELHGEFHQVIANQSTKILDRLPLDVMPATFPGDERVDAIMEATFSIFGK